MIFLNQNDINKYCEPCAFSEKIRITIEDDNHEEELFNIQTWGEVSGDYTLTSNSHTVPNGDITVTGIQRNPPSITISGIVVGNYQHSDALLDEASSYINTAMGVSGFAALAIGTDKLNGITDQTSKGFRAITTYYNTAMSTVSIGQKIAGLLSNTTKAVAECNTAMINTFFNKKNRKCAIYFNGVKYKNFALSFSYRYDSTEKVEYDIIATYAPTVDTEPALTKTKLGFVPGLTGSAEDLTTQTEEATTFIKSLVDNIKLF